MLIIEGEARTHRLNEHLAATFAAIAGALNAAGFYAFGTYSSNMTGNVSAMADHLGLGDLLIAFHALVLVGAFLLGAMAATALISFGRERYRRNAYIYSVLVEAVLLVTLGAIAPLVPVGNQSIVMIVGLSFVLGLQNATTTQITNARVRTTHVTGMVTDIGIGLAQILERNPATDRSKLRLHTITVAAFLMGGIVGVLLYRPMGTAVLFIAAGLLALIAVPGISTARRL